MGNPLYQLLGAFDLLSAFVMVLTHLDILGWKLGFVSSIYLFAKAYAFKGDMASILDGLCGLWLLLVIAGLHLSITYVVAFYLFQKAIVSFF